MKASDVLVQALENEGVRYIFGIPGEENLDLLESLRNSSIELVVTRHEQSAGFMAATWGRLTGRTGVCLSTLGPGATNFFTAAAYAHLGRMPVLFLTGQKPIRTSKQGRFQIIDVVSMMAPVTKLARQIVDGNNIPSLVRECFRLAEQEKPGAVHLELPEDVAAEAVERQPFEVTAVEPAGASETALERAAQLLLTAKMPLVCIASGANRLKTHQCLRDFIDRTGLYFFNTQMGKGAIDERHPRFLGTAALSKDDYVHCAIDRADVVLNIGHDVTEKPPFLMASGGTKTVIHLADSCAQVDDVYFPQHEVIGCLSANLPQLCERITQPGMTKLPNWDLGYFERVRAQMEAHVYAPVDNANRFPLPPQTVVAEVRDAMPSEAIVCLDNGMYKLWFARDYKAHAPNSLLLDNALATMGAGLPAAMGAKIAYPERPVVAVCGDGGFMMNSQELETAVRLQLDLVVMVLRDDGYGMIKWKQTGMGFADYGLDFGNPDFVMYAQAYGAHGHRLQQGHSLSDLLKRCVEQGGVHLVEVAVDYEENVKVFYEELRAKTCTL